MLSGSSVTAKAIPMLQDKYDENVLRMALNSLFDELLSQKLVCKSSAGTAEVRSFRHVVDGSKWSRFGSSYTTHDPPPQKCLDFLKIRYAIPSF